MVCISVSSCEHSIDLVIALLNDSSVLKKLYGDFKKGIIVAYIAGERGNSFYYYIRRRYYRYYSLSICVTVYNNLIPQAFSAATGK